MKSYISYLIIIFLVVGSVFALGSSYKKEFGPIHNLTYMGVASLNVKDLEAEKYYYNKVLLFDIINETKNEVLLGKNTPLLKLVKRSDLYFPQDKEPGLYHVAYLYSSRGELSRVLVNAFEKSSGSFAGSANHAVSEAFYFFDPEGNGIELYYDIDKSLWKYNNSYVEMETKALDVVKYVNTYYNNDVGKVSVRHLHLKGSNIDEARKFYSDDLGFDVMKQSDNAVFMSAGGYHHNIAVNTWLSLGSPPRGETLGLNYFEIAIPKSYVNEMISRLKAKKVKFKQNKEFIELSDPFGNKIHIVSFSP